jgi:hypothetical protein
MNGAMERVRQNQERLAQIETLEQALHQVQDELQSYREALCHKLAWLRQQESAPDAAEPAAPEPEPELPQVLPLALAAARTLVAGEPRGAERRACRRRVGNPIAISIADATARSGWVTDRSQHGVGLRTDDEEPVGAILRIRPNKSTEWTRVVVKHCRHDERGTWVVGCQFVEKVPSKQMRMFG